MLGGPGAGKGTQAEQLCRTLQIPCISTGEMLRDAIAAQTNLGKQVQAQVESGDLVSDDAMIQFIRDRLSQPTVTRGWLLDGYPRTAFQAEELDFLLNTLEQQLDKAILLDVPDAVLIERSLSRGRIDDTLETIQRRIALFRERTSLLEDYYEFCDRLLRINGNQSVELVHQEILQTLGNQ
jgi:adenylate kinase